MGKKEPRRFSRLRAFQVLYGLEFSPATDSGELERKFTKAPPPDEQQADDLEEYESETQGFAWDLCLGVWTHKEQLDELVTRFSKHWKLSRIARVELVILRLSLFEMLHRSDVPVKVSINEAIELAKHFGDDNSPGFVNGILDAAAKALEHGEIGLH